MNAPSPTMGRAALPMHLPWLVARSAVAGLQLLSLDDRIRVVGKRLGLALVPDRIS